MGTHGDGGSGRGGTGRGLPALCMVATGVLAVALLDPAAATTSGGGTCVPAEAWVETVEHPALTHLRTVHHEAVTNQVHHPAVTTTTHHEATEGHWARLEWHVWPDGPRESPPQPGEPGWHPVPALPEGMPHAPRPGSVYNVSHDLPGLGSWFLWTGTWVEGTAAWDETTVLVPAYDESVVVSAAFDETVVVVDTPAWTERVEHAAVKCPPGDPGDPPDPPGPPGPPDPGDPAGPGDPGGPGGTDGGTDGGTETSEDRLTTRSERDYTCEALTTTRFERRGEGPWVRVGRTVTPITLAECPRGADPAAVWAEEGL